MASFSPGQASARQWLLDDDDAAIKQAAHASLKQLTGEDFGTSVKAWREWLAKQE